jgi:biopolymer transport protein TolQ
MCRFQKQVKCSVYQEAEQTKRSPIAHMFKAGYVELSKLHKGKTGAPGEAGMHDDLENVERALRRAATSEATQLESMIPFLATVGSAAPFIGLFGTVVGIINAFKSIAAAGSGGMAVVSGGIAEALVSTALGIFVAIPAVVAFNHFTGKIENFHVEMNRASSQLVNSLFKMPDLKISDDEMSEVANAAR